MTTTKSKSEDTLWQRQLRLSSRTSRSFSSSLFSVLALVLAVMVLSASASIDSISPRFGDSNDGSNDWRYGPTSFLCGATPNDDRRREEVIPIEKVNDDYCDCGRDEPRTSACPNGRFYCSTSIGSSVQRWIPSSMVNDGICDCCDGSDEPISSGVACENTCAKLLTAKRLEAERRRDEILAANKKKQQYVQKSSKKDLSEAPKRLESYANDAERERYALMELANTRRISQPVLEKKANKLRRDFAWIQLVSELLSTVNSKSQQVQQLFGKSLEYLQLLWNCYSFTTNEKQFRGGSTREAGPETFRFEFCPFINVTQKSITVPENDVVVLGLWKGWDRAKERATNSPTMIYGDGSGDACYRGPQRRVQVNFVCGLENQILDINEDGMCLYYIQFQTPAACRAELAYSKSITQFLSNDGVEDVMT